MGELFVPVCSITMTKRRRFFWAAWWTGAPAHMPFKKPDASDGGAASLEEALANAEKRAGVSLSLIDPLWARAWIRILRGEEAWPSKASREPAGRAPPSRVVAEPGSIWELLGVTSDATEAELKVAFRKRAIELHPDQGGDEEVFRRLVSAHAEAQRRIKKPRPRRT